MGKNVSWKKEKQGGKEKQQSRKEKGKEAKILNRESLKSKKESCLLRLLCHINNPSGHSPVCVLGTCTSLVLP